MNIRQASKTTSIDNALEKIRNNFFYVIFLIVQGNGTSKIFVIFSNIFIFFQYCYLNFGLKIKYIWQDPIVETINLLLKYFTITINVKNIGFINYLYVFYASLTLVLIAIILMLLLIFVFKTKRFQQIPIFLLRQILKLILTFGYWPIVRMQFGLLACQYNKKGQYVMMFEAKQECWVGNYTFHAIIAIFGLPITIIYTVTIQYFAYQKRLNKHNALAMQNSQSQVTLLLYIFIQIMVYQLTPTPQHTFLIIFVYLIGSGFYFKMTHIEQPFCHEIIQKFMSIISSINLWVIIMMMYAYFMESEYFNHSLVILLLTIPLIIGLILQQNFYKFQTILHDLNSQNDGKKIINLCNYLLHLLEKSVNNQRCSLLLQSFIEIHREVCQKSDCYAKKASYYMADTNQMQYIITHVINQIFVDGLQKYPEDIDLRLNYIFFLVDHRNQYSQALSEIFIAEQFSQSNNQKFQLYLNKKIIQQYLVDAKNTIKFDKFADAAFQKQDKEFYSLIENVTHLFIDFWSQLQEEIINISILLQIGYNLLKQKKEIQQKYLIIMSQSRKATKISQFYEDYLQLVANEKISSELKLKQKDKYDVFQKEQLEEIQNQPNPIAIISAHTHQEPQFLSVNKSFCRFIGYTKTDLIKMPLNNIIPLSFSVRHTQCIENFLIHKVTQVSSQLIKSKVVFVKQKNKYITSSWVEVKLMEAHHNELILVAQFQPQFQIKNTCYIIISKTGIMLDMTSNCIPLLGMEVESILLNQINIQELFPDFLMMKNEFKKKSGSVIVYQNSLAQLKKSIRSKSSISSLRISSKFLCHISDIDFPCLKEENVEKTGILIKLELITQKTFKKQDNFICQTLKSIKSKKIGYFRFAQKQLKYQMDEIFVDEIENFDDQILLNENLSKVIGIAGCLKMSRRLKTQILKIQNYGEGIRTCRLMNNHIVDINNIEEENLEEDYEKEVNDEKEQLEQDIQKAISNNFLQKLQSDSYFASQLRETKILEYLNNTPIPLKLKIHIQIINIFFLLFIGLQILSFVFSFQNENLLVNHIGTTSVVNQRMSGIFMIQSILQDIRFINLKYYQEENVTQAFDEQIKLLDNEIQQLQQNHNYLSQIQIEPSKQYHEIAQPFNQKNVQMMDYLGNQQYYSFKETVDQLISKALLLKNEEISNFSFDKPDFFYYLYNSLNSVFQSEKLAETYYQCIIFTILDQTNDSNKLFFILTTILISCLCLIIIFFLMQIHIDIGQIINLIVDFEENSLMKLKQNCESFLNILFFDEFEEIKSEDQDEKALQMDTNIKTQQKKRKINSKNSIISLRKLLIKVGVISIILQLYFTFMYFDSKIVINEYYEIIPILNKTSIVEDYYRLQDNFIRELMISPNISILNSKNSTDTVFEFFDTLYNLNADLFEITNEHKQFLQTSYQHIFDQIQLFNPCNLIDVNRSQCENFQDGILQQGQSVANIKYIEDLRILYYEYEYNFEVEQQNDEIEISDSNSTKIQTYNFLVSLLNSDRAKNARKMQQVYLRKLQQFLVKALETSIVDSFNQLMTRKSIFLVFFILIFVFIFLLWIPLSKEQLEKLNQTKQILTLFPFEMLIKSYQAIIYFKNLQIW